MGCVLLPVIDDTTDGDPITYRNDTDVYVDKSVSTGEVEITKEANSTTVTINSNTRTSDSVARPLSLRLTTLKPDIKC